MGIFPTKPHARAMYLSSEDKLTRIVTLSETGSFLGTDSDLEIDPNSIAYPGFASLI